MKMHRIIYILPLLLVACSEIPPEAYSSRGGPESLLDTSSERVSLNLVSDASLDDLVNWLNEDQPSRMELGCQEGDPLCSKAMDIAAQFSVPVEFSKDAGSGIVLVYDRVVARDCENRYITNHINPYNLNHPTFGCSVAANALQMISDKQQIVAPSLMDMQDGKKAAQGVDAYSTAPANTTTFPYPPIFEFRGDSGGGSAGGG